jgi:hypothetical protein
MTGATTTTLSGGGALTVLAFVLAIWLIQIISFWKVFTKAGQAGILAIIPIVNLVILMKIINRSGWFALLFFLPIANIVWLFISNIELAKKFGKGAGFGVLMTFIPIIGYPILGFGDATYNANA